MNIVTQYTYENKWTSTSEREALRMINEEMPEADAEATLSYIVSEISRGKTVTLGSCRFKKESKT